jgi:hypothetical protein
MPKGKSTGPRQQRPVFAIVTYRDADGNAQSLNKDGLSIQIERDSAKIVEALTGGDDSLAGATVVRVQLPQPTPRKATEGAAASA